jgi:glyoxalase family protein
MDHKILGLHHVTATVDDAQQDLDFFRDVLGLRLVKRTVNFDNHNVFHFYYGNEQGTPGTIWTTFPYGGWGVPLGTKGAGQIGATSFSVPVGSLDEWRARLAGKGIAVGDGPSRFGDASILFADGSGLIVELVASDRDARTPWIAAGIDPEMAIRGLHSVTMHVRVPDASVRFMTDVLGFSVVNEMEGRIRLAVNGDEPGKTIEIAHDLSAPSARNGLGTVHHVAMAIATGEEQRRLQQDLWHLGYQVTDVLDRQYFTSIYFREPGGVLFEVATIPPGFLIDEDLAHLGEALRLPPWEEANRLEIEAGLPKVTS